MDDLHFYRIINKERRRTKALAAILFGMIGLFFIIATLCLVSCFRVPVQVVQYDNEPAFTVAPVGKVFISPATATQPQTAVMNPQVKDPETVGPLPPKPQPIPTGGLDWLSMLLGAGSLAIPALAVAKVLVNRVRSAVAVGTELVGKIQEVKAAHPATKDSINETLAKNQSEEARKFVEKVKGKDRPKKVQG
jgi:hypothetical protein